MNENMLLKNNKKIKYIVVSFILELFCSFFIIVIYLLMGIVEINDLILWVLKLEVKC